MRVVCYVRMMGDGVGWLDLMIYLCDVKSHCLGETWIEFLCLETRDKSSSRK